MTDNKQTKEDIAPVNMDGWRSIKIAAIARGEKEYSIIERAEEYIHELLGDFEAVKDMNRVVSIRYAEFIEALPTAAEIDDIITSYTELLDAGAAQGTDPGFGTHMIIDERVRLLRKLKSAVERLNDTSKEQGAQPEIPTETRA